MIKKEEILKKAYQLGYFVGFYGHTEWVRWISKEKEQIYSTAKSLGIYDEVRKAYALGKDDGTKKREELLQKGLSIEPPEDQEEIKLILKGITKEEKTEKHYLHFLKLSKITAKPEFLTNTELTKKPKFLKLPRFIKE